MFSGIHQKLKTIKINPHLLINNDIMIHALILKNQF